MSDTSSAQRKNGFPFINANTLTVLAGIFMLSDHLWATIIPGNNWMTYIGRLAFPLYAFKISEGFVHTSDIKKYAKRLFIFALISEIPFNMMYISYPVFPLHQNVMFTLLLGLLCIWEIDKVRKNTSVKNVIISASKISLYLFLSVFGFVDYGIWGVLTVVLFYVCRGFKFKNIMLTAGMIFINIFGFKGQQLPLNIFGNNLMFPVQGFAVFSLVFVFLYNGEKAPSTKAGKFFSYAFYPLHMLILSLIRYVM
ncbi:MAG: conjugal transfer protein TraX [Anaerofustis stercorihominis]|nr:conjugal transfer protein TraX [Anaerofustis stercorihominis]